MQLARLEQAVAEEIDAQKGTGFNLRFVGLEAHLKWEFDPRIPIAAAAAAQTIGIPVLETSGGWMRDSINSMRLRSRAGWAKGVVDPETAEGARHRPPCVVGERQEPIASSVNLERREAEIIPAVDCLAGGIDLEEMVLDMKCGGAV